MGKYIDITGHKFGRLTAVRFSHIKKGHYYWLFKCDCGKEVITTKGDVVDGRIKSCGCYSLKKLIQRSIKHGMARRKKTRFYNVWCGIKQRCNYPNI